MSMYTVIGYEESNGQIFCDHVDAESGESAMSVVAEERPTSTLVVAVKGELSEQDGNLAFPGFGVVDAETYLS